MRENSFILVVLVLSVGLVVGLTLWRDHGGQDGVWRSNELYSKYDVMSRASSTFTSASYSSGMSNDGVALTMRHRSFGSTRAHVPSYSYARSTPMTSGQGSVASAGGIYTTSSSEYRSFGGGGMGAGMSMGGARSATSNGAIAQAGGVYTSMPTGVSYSSSSSAANGVQMPISGNEMMAMNNPANDFSAASASASAYSGWGETTAMYGTATYGGNGSNPVSGRRNADSQGYESWKQWMWLHGWRFGTDEGDGTYSYNTGQAKDAFLAWYLATYGEPYVEGAAQINYEQWIDWYTSNTGEHSHNGKNFIFFQSPVGDILSLVVFALLYATYVFIRRYKKQTKQA